MAGNTGIQRHLEVARQIGPLAAQPDHRETHQAEGHQRSDRGQVAELVDVEDGGGERHQHADDDAY